MPQVSNNNKIHHVFRGKTCQRMFYKGCQNVEVHTWHSVSILLHTYTSRITGCQNTDILIEKRSVFILQEQMNQHDVNCQMSEILFKTSVNLSMWGLLLFSKALGLWFDEIWEFKDIPKDSLGIWAMFCSSLDNYHFTGQRKRSPLTHPIVKLIYSLSLWMIYKQFQWWCLSVSS